MKDKLDKKVLGKKIIQSKIIQSKKKKIVRKKMLGANMIEFAILITLLAALAVPTVQLFGYRVANVFCGAMEENVLTPLNGFDSELGKCKKSECVPPKTPHSVVGPDGSAYHYCE